MAARRFLFVGLLATLLASVARAEIPALSRPLSVESYERDPASIDDLKETFGMAGGIALLYVARALESGNADPRITQGDFGGRGSFTLLYHRYTSMFDATSDGELNVDSREYPSRVALGALWPELFLSAQLVAGFDTDRYGGTDLAIETAPLPIPLISHGADFRPELVAWVRGRKFDAEDQPILNPALALSIDHLPALASAFGLAISAQTDLASGFAPSAFGMVQLSFRTHEKSLSGEDADLPARGVPGARTSSLQRGWFGYSAYAFPLDSGQFARFAIGLGAHFSAPLGR
jgi:hypothetical protein